MIQELHRKLTIDSILIISSNNFVNLSEIPFPAITLMGTTLMDINLLSELDEPQILNGRILSDKEKWDL